jgi:hypothetical protein
MEPDVGRGQALPGAWATISVAAVTAASGSRNTSMPPSPNQRTGRPPELLVGARQPWLGGHDRNVHEGERQVTPGDEVADRLHCQAGGV